MGNRKTRFLAAAVLGAGSLLVPFCLHADVPPDGAESVEASVLLEEISAKKQPAPKTAAVEAPAESAASPFRFVVDSDDIEAFEGVQKEGPSKNPFALSDTDYSFGFNEDGDPGFGKRF